MSSAKFTRQFSYQFCTPITGGAHESWTLVGSVDTSFEVALDTDYALIVKIGNTGDMSATEDFKLQYNVSGAGWNDVNASSSNVRTAASGDTDDATSATERLTTSARTFQASTLDEGDGANILNVSGINDVEFYFALNFRSADLTAGEESITFKVVDAGGDIDAYDITPTATLPALGNTELPLLADPSPTITGYAPTASISIPITVGTAPLQFVYVIGLKLEGQPLTIDVALGSNTELPLLGELDLAGIIPTTIVANNVAPGLDTLALSGNAPTAVVGNVVLPGLDTLVLGEQTPDPIQGQVEQPLLGTLALGIAGSAPDAVIANVREPATDALSLGVVGSDPTASVGELREPATIGLSLDGRVPTLGAYDIPEAPGLGTLALASDVVTVVHNRLSDALLDTLSLDGKIPITSVGDLREPPIDELALASDVITVQHNRLSDVPLGTLVLGGKVPDIPSEGGIEVPTGGVNIYKYIGLKIDGFPPTVSDGNTVSPSTIGLSLDGKVPTLGASDNPETPSLGTLALSGVAPQAVIANTTLPTTAGLSLSGQAPSVGGIEIEIPSGYVNIYKYIGLKLDGFPPSLTFTDTVSPSTVGLSFSGSTADLNVTVLPSTASVDFSGIIPTVSGTVLPPTGALVLQGHAPVDQDTVAVPVGSLALAGIAPALKGVTAPTTIGLNLSGQPLTVDYIAAPSPSTVSLGLSSVAPSAIQSHITTTSTGALSLAGTIPVRYVDAAGSFTCVPNTAALTLAEQGVATSGLGLVDPLGVSLSLSGKIPTAEVDKTVSPSTAGLVLYSANRVIGTARFNLTGQPVTIAYHDGTLIQNLDASTDIISNIEECDYSGFKVMPGSLKMTWNKYAVRQKSYEDRHPSDVPHRTHPQRKRGPQRPEPDDTFLDTDVSPEDY